MHKLDPIDAASIRDDIPNFRPGDTVKVHAKVIEGERTRIQIFHGVVIARKGAGVRESCTVGKVAFGVCVERAFPVDAATVDLTRIVTRSDVLRAKLYNLRGLPGAPTRHA